MRKPRKLKGNALEIIRRPLARKPDRPALFRKRKPFLIYRAEKAGLRVRGQKSRGIGAAVVVGWSWVAIA